ncbi:MAG: septation regulator SpoVG [Candidatus Zixiibacteriota bacterium]|nr:MAG: septation regulator SpoVG [candidate division Zixibacteria bacterium]
MEITEIRLTIRNEDKLKAFANVTFDNALVIRGLKIISGNKGLFISMPSKKRPNGTYQDIAHPINTEMRRMVENAVLEAYENEIKKAGMSGNIKKSE